MINRFSKQILLFFVLPVAVFLTVIILAVVIDIPENERSTILISASVVFLAVFSVFTYKMLQSYILVDLALNKLNDESALQEEQKHPTQVFSSILKSVDHVSRRMKQQQEELTQERIRRLRSLIDGQDQERHRLSRELHDGIGQSLIAVKLQLENSGTQGHSQMRASVDMAKTMIDQTIDEVRRVTNALLPAALNEFGLVTALQARCDEMALIAGLKLNFECSGSVDRLENKSKTYLYRIAQEAITNTIKHARATRIDVKLLREDLQVTLIVADNGKGFIFDPITFAHRNGLQNIRERVALLQGSFTIETAPDAGTTLRISIPYKTGNG